MRAGEGGGGGVGVVGDGVGGEGRGDDVLDGCLVLGFGMWLVVTGME